MSGRPLELYSAYLDGRCLRDDEVAALRAWIAADEGNANEFVRMAILHAAISDRLVLGKLFDDLATHRLGIITPESLAEAIREIESKSPRIERDMPPVVGDARTVSGFAAPIAAVAAAFILIGAWALWGDTGPTVPQGVPTQGHVLRTVTTPKAKPLPVVAKVGATFGAKWMFDEFRIPGDQLRQGERVDLLAGVAELQMESGVVVVLEGPCHVELQGPDALSLADGKAAVRNDGAADTFVINTPTMQVVDRGTEFGVGTSPLGETLIAVYDGSVAIADAAATDAKAPGLAPERRLDAGFEVKLRSADMPAEREWTPQPVKNDRVFVRPDEVKIRLRAEAGSLADQKLADHFRRQRIKGLLAYQGFDDASSGMDYVLGLSGQGIMAMGSIAFLGSARGAAGGLDVQNGPAFMGFDTSPEGPFGRAGLITPTGLIGRPGTEVWLTWRTQRFGPVLESQSSAGLSLMFGERPDLDEPLFLGQAANGHVPYCAETAWGNEPPPNGRRISADIDFDHVTPGNQPLAVDDEAHTWVLRVEFRDGADRASVWIDADLASLDPQAPHTTLDVSNIEFDRLRLAAHRGNEVWRFSEIAAALNPEALRELVQVNKFLVDR